MPKTWGPFTGRQLTTMVVALIAGVVLLPGAVWAVDSFSNVAVQDPVSGVKASVDAGHHVVVGDGSGPLTVDGNVIAQQAAPANLWRAAASGGGGCTVIGTPPTGKAVVLKTVSVNLYSAPAGTLSGGHFITLYNSKTCSGVPLWDFTPTQLGPQKLSLEAGVGIPSTAGLSTADFNGAGYGYEVYALGYTVSASAVPTSAASADTGATTRGPGPPATAP